MNEEKEFKYIMEHKKILRIPKHNLATFGVTNIYYYLLASSLPNKVKIREGRIISERPKILLPQQLDNIFEGFDKDAEIMKLKKELDYNEGFLKSVENKLKNENFVKNAPAAIVNIEKQKILDAKSKIKSLQKSISELS